MVALTAQDIARELLIDSRRVMVEEFAPGVFVQAPVPLLAVKVARDGDQRWSAWYMPAESEALPVVVLDGMQKWLKSGWPTA